MGYGSGKLSNDDLVTLVRREVDTALGYDEDVLATKRKLALDYYHGKMEAAPEGRSNIVSHDVADTVHALLAQVVPVFESSTLEFTADSEEDEKQSQLESDFVKAELEKSDGYKILSEAAHDALLISNGWIKVAVGEETITTNEMYGPMDPEQLQAVIEPQGMNQTVRAKETDEGYEIERDTINKTLTVECMAPEIMVYSSDDGVYDLQKLRMVGERLLLTGSQLKEMGVSENDIGEIPIAADDYWAGIRARQGVYQDSNQQDEGGDQTAEKLHECFDVHMRIDRDDTGSVELRHIVIGGTVLIKNEPATHIPYATGSPVPMPHRIQGTGMFELMFQVQDAKTATMRQFIDNLGVMNQSRLGVVDGDVNIEDLTNGRINGIVRMKHANAIVPLPGADIGQQAITGMNYLDSVREQRGGASLDLNDSDRQIMASSATAASGQMANKEKMAGWYCYNLVHSLLKNVYFLVHKTLREEVTSPIQAKMRGKWVETTPSDWKVRKQIDVLAGMTSSERAQKTQALTLTIQQLQGMIQQGGEGIITNRAKLYNAMADWIRTVDLGAPEDYLLDPESEESQKVTEGASKAAQETQQKQEAAAQELLKIERDKIAFDKYKVDKELEFKYAELASKAEQKEAELTVGAIGKAAEMENMANMKSMDKMKEGNENIQ